MSKLFDSIYNGSRTDDGRMPITSHHNKTGSDEACATSIRCCDACGSPFVPIQYSHTLCGSCEGVRRQASTGWSAMENSLHAFN